MSCVLQRPEDLFGIQYPLDLGEGYVCVAPGSVCNVLM